MRVRSVVCLSVLLLASAAVAASPTGAILSKLKKDLKSSVKSSLTVIMAERQIALTQMKPLVDIAKANVLAPGTAIGAASPVVAFQAQMRTRIDDGLFAIASTMRSSRVAFELVEPSATALPTGMTYGDRGVGDAAEADFLKKVDAAYAPLRKSIAAFAKALRAKSNVAFTMLVRPPTPAEFPGFDESSYFGSYVEFTLDFACAASDLSVADDGVIAFGGSADPFEGDVTVAVNGPDSTTTTVTPDPITGRWLYVFDKAGQGVKEASYVVRARQGTDTSWTNWHIGVQWRIVREMKKSSASG